MQIQKEGILLNDCITCDMKRLLYALFFITIFCVSCGTDDTPVPELHEGVSMRINITDEHSFLNYSDLQNAEIIFSLHSVSLQEISGIKIFVEYHNFESDSTYPLGEAFHFLPTDFNAQGAITDISFSAEDLATAVNLPSIDVIGGGDLLTFYNETRLRDGQIYSGPSVSDSYIDPLSFYDNSSSSFSEGFIAYIACPSDATDWEGTYESTTTYVTVFCDNEIGCKTTREAIITRDYSPEPFKYRTSSHDGGFWGGFDENSYDRIGKFFDICGNPVLLPSETGYGEHEDAGGSFRDPATGIFVINWCNYFNPVCGRTEFVPID